MEINRREWTRKHADLPVTTSIMIDRFFETLRCFLRITFYPYER